jgi:DNA-binding CsgD family transcriptional regulator
MRPTVERLLGTGCQFGDHCGYLVGVAGQRRRPHRIRSFVHRATSSVIAATATRRTENCVLTASFEYVPRALHDLGQLLYSGNRRIGTYVGLRRAPPQFVGDERRGTEMDVRRREVEWLNFTAELLTGQVRELPVERVALRLLATFGSLACAFASPGGDPPRFRIWHSAEGDGGSHELWCLRDWEPYFRSIGTEHHLVIPIEAAPRRCKTFIIGREHAYSSAEAEFTGVLRRLLAGIDRHLTIFAGAAHDLRSTNGFDRDLTRREITVLELVASGMTAAAAGRRLAIAERTVHKHLEHAYRKLDATDRISAILRAKRLGLLN